MQRRHAVESLWPLPRPPTNPHLPYRGAALQVSPLSSCYVRFTSLLNGKKATSFFTHLIDASAVLEDIVQSSKEAKGCCCAGTSRSTTPDMVRSCRTSGNNHVQLSNLSAVLSNLHIALSDGSVVEADGVIPVHMFLTPIRVRPHSLVLRCCENPKPRFDNMRATLWPHLLSLSCGILAL